MPIEVVIAPGPQLDDERVAHTAHHSGHIMDALRMKDDGVAALQVVVTHGMPTLPGHKGAALEARRVPSQCLTELSLRCVHIAVGFACDAEVDLCRHVSIRTPLD